MQFETLAVHEGRDIDPTTGAVAPPIHLSTTFERDPDGGFSRGFEYIRDDNPNRRSLEACLSALEGGIATVAFPSGMAAISAAIEALRTSHEGALFVPRDVYFGMRALLTETEFGRKLDVVTVDMTDAAAVERATRDRKPGIIWVETPSNPLVSIVDIAAISAIARKHGAAVVVDNTWATPFLQRPLELGADVVVHSLTKYIGGHSDVMVGAAIVRKDGPHLVELRSIQRNKGLVPAPFDCWLALRGASSLAARMTVHCGSAMAIANFLQGHPAVTAVHYPGLPAHSGHEVAKRQMRDFGGMLSFEVRGGREEAMSVAAALKVFTRATSLGGNHSLIEHRASVEGPATMAPEGLLRAAIGLENVSDLIGDLRQALAAITE
ncbi:cystathionine gamma-synthase [Sphingomonas kaistensis]|uniref:Cystathionine gamma-synthase n=1 Tax=Sphingomonas kaistensis TaxID=298708 RepID=A0A7X5Y9J3_9SPHN|nr:aminotransferase class I/II-fold pyridoxal phosphate-dependent enzyme [Sphingomonas kaistensis]NJC06430.1 cystathionine gamma-synthase [Sphingomonas kaistensis]